MLIDFHTHIFPDAIAARTLEILVNGIRRQQGDAFVAGRTMHHTDGTLQGLLDSMEDNHVDMSICLPIVTKMSQTESINRFAYGIRNQVTQSFGSLHPLQPDWEQVLEQLAEKGFRGIKLHHQFQLCDIDSKESIRVLKKAGALGLLVIFHAGADIGLPPPVYATPEKIRNVLTEMDGSHLIAAHLGGWRMWDDVERYLLGTSIYLDTAYIREYIDPVQCKRIIDAHGADRVLFGSDSPWENPSETLAFLQSLALTQEQMDAITHRNAQRLLGLE